MTVDGTSGVTVKAPGSTATVTAADVYTSNGVIHIIDTVLLPAG
ncbi:MAG: fasciclin domain-containing protein [Pseudomonadota bacterium]